MEYNDKDSKFKLGNHVIISKYKTFFAKVYTATWSEEVFVTGKVKNVVPWIYVIGDFSGKKIDKTFYEKELQKKLGRVWIRKKDKEKR